MKFKLTKVEKAYFIGWMNGLIAGLMILVVYTAFIVPVSSATKFDHSQCAYPYRLSNPVDGCDNSDPACPLEIKGGSCETYQPSVEEQSPHVPENEPTNKCME